MSKEKSKLGPPYKYGEEMKMFSMRLPEDLHATAKKMLSEELKKREALRKAFAEKVKNTNPLNK